MSFNVNPWILQLVGVLRAVVATRRGNKLMDNLMDHCDSCSQTRNTKTDQLFGRMTEDLGRLTRAEVTCDEVARACGVVKTNSMALSGLEARAVYPMVSVFSHSCQRNVIPVVGPGEAVAFKTVRPVKLNEEFNIRYSSKTVNNKTSHYC